MHCARCQHDYCWLCQGPNYHSDYFERFCPTRWVVLKIIVLLVVVFFNEKLIREFETLKEIEYWFFFYLGAAIYVDVLLLSIWLQYFWWSDLRRRF